MELGKFIVFIHKKLTGEFKEEESQVRSDWSSEEHRDVERQVRDIWSASLSYKSKYQPDTEKSWGAFSAKLAAEKTRPRPRVLLGQRLAFAATVLLLILAGAYWWTNSRQDSAMQVVTTVGHETKSVALPDETTIILNQNSRLAYSRQWEKADERRVEFSGEAFFEVKPDAQKPFRIETDQSQVEVLGTSFNLRAYPDEQYTEVAVTEGRVQLASRQSSETILLTKGQVGRLDHRENSVRSIPHSAYNSQFWHTQELSFRKAPMLEIAETLERFFNVDIRFKTVAISQCPSDFNFNYTGETLEELLEILKLSLRLDIERTGERAYLFSGGYCDKSH